jgi:DNA-binding HxlR family transcriptional regulator
MSSCDCSGLNCPVDATLRLIGGKYKSLILWHLMSGTMRHGELQKIIPQATPKMLTQQLRELESDDLISRTVYPVVPPKVEYALTALGRSLNPVLVAMYDWGSVYMQDNNCQISCSMTRNPDHT